MTQGTVNTDPAQNVSTRSLIIANKVAQGADFNERRKLAIWYEQFNIRSLPLDQVKDKKLPLIGVLWYDAMVPVDKKDKDKYPDAIVPEDEDFPYLLGPGGEVIQEERNVSLWLTKDGTVYASWSPVIREYTLSLVNQYGDRFEGTVWVTPGDQLTKARRHTYAPKQVEGD